MVFLPVFIVTLRGLHYSSQPFIFAIKERFMRKSDKLYTANKWNQPLFMQDLQDGEPNILADAGFLNNITQGSNTSYVDNIRANPPGMLTQNNLNSYYSIGNVGTKGAVSGSENTGNTGGGNNKIAALQMAGGAAAQVAGLPMGSYRNGMFDAADPVYHLAGGRESAAGNALSDTGVKVFQQAAASGNPWGMIAGAAFKVAGGLTNAAWGIKTDKQRLGSIKSGLSTLGSYKSQAADFDDVVGPASIVDNTAGIYKGGWFSKGKAREKNEALTKQVTEAKALANRSLANNVENISKTNMDNLSANFAAFGGPLGDNGGAIDYGFMADYLTNKKKAADVKDKIPAGTFGSDMPMYALGGVMQTNGADFSDGLVTINAGGSHEENPFEGVQMGISKENGQPNLVEEGETVFDDYVFSKRIKVDPETKKVFHVGKNSDITYADLSKRLEKESVERPNDPISQASLKRQLHRLAEEQERQKQEDQARQMQEAFAQLSPEQQQEVMQQMAMEQQQAEQQQAEMQGQQNLSAEQQQALAQQQMEGQQGAEEQMVQEQPQAEEVQMAANGGKLNKFSTGGNLVTRAVYKALGFANDEQFKKWAKRVGLDLNNIGKDKATDNFDLREALMSKDAILKDVVGEGYNWGEYTPSSSIYDFVPFRDKLAAYNQSLQEGNTKGKYKPDKNFPLGDYKTLEDLENADDYKAYTQYLADLANRAKGIEFSDPTTESGWKPYKDITWANENNRLSEDDYDALQTLWYHTKGTKTKSEGKPVPLFNVSDGKLSIADNAADLITKYRTDGEGGIFHFTPDLKARGQSIINKVVHGDGSIDLIKGEVPKDWTVNRTYSWKDKDKDNTVVYYNEPGAKAKAPADGEKKAEDEYEVVPVHKGTWQRDLGMMGPGLAMGLQLSGLGAPDYTGLDTALGHINEPPTLAKYKPISNYLTYRPMDVMYGLNKQNAISRSTDRYIANNSSPLGTKIAGQLANGYNSQIASGDLFAKALEYNNAQRQKVEEFNKDTDKYNATAFTQTSATNAGIMNDWRRARAQLGLDVAKEKLNTEASWYSNLYKNMDNIFKGFADVGKENAQHDMIADMAADGLFGKLTNQNLANGYLIRKVKKKNGNISAKGGKINRKRGLTF